MIIGKDKYTVSFASKIVFENDTEFYNHFSKVRNEFQDVDEGDIFF